MCVRVHARACVCARVCDCMCVRACVRVQRQRYAHLIWPTKLENTRRVGGSKKRSIHEGRKEEAKGLA